MTKETKKDILAMVALMKFHDHSIVMEPWQIEVICAEMRLLRRELMEFLSDCIDGKEERLPLLVAGE